MGKGNQKKKTIKQVVAYKQFLSDPHNLPEDTISICNDSLRGSNEMESDEDDTISSDAYLRMPWYKKLWRWVLSHGFAVLLVTLLVSFGAWTVNAIHANDVAIAEVTVRIEYIERNLEKLSSEGVNTEQVNAELKQLKSELQTSFLLDMSDIEHRIDIIELNLKESHG